MSIYLNGLFDNNADEVMAQRDQRRSKHLNRSSRANDTSTECMRERERGKEKWLNGEPIGDAAAAVRLLFISKSPIKIIIRAWKQNDKSGRETKLE